jgi:uncharacterized protein YsxB (DUF464 family)
VIHVHVKEQNGRIVSLDVTGHAESGPYGQDLVCAGVSSIVTGLGNALDEMIPGCQLSCRENRFSFVIPHPDEKSEMVMRTGLIQLKTMEEVSGKYMKIETEVLKP